jgi:hypothetical protein
VPDPEQTWQIGTDVIATIEASEFGQWSPTDPDPDNDTWANADDSQRPVSWRAVKRGVMQLAEVASGERTVLAVDCTGDVACESVTLHENASVPGGAPAAGDGVLWVRNDTPNTLVFTDDAGTDWDVSGSGAVEDLETTLTAGNTTGANDIEITTGQALVGQAGGSIEFDGLGDITVTPTATATVDGDLEVTGKLTVAGLIDPTGLVLDEQAAVPFVTAPGKATLWVRDTTPNRLEFTDDAGTDFQMATTADVAATTLADVLSADPSTGANNIEIANGQGIRGEDAGTIDFESTTGVIKTTAMSIGDPGTESDDIVIGGTTFSGQAKVAAFGGATTVSMIIDRHSTTLPAMIVAGRSKSDTSSHTIVADNDELFALVAAGYDGTDYATGGRLAWEVDGTPGAGDMPTRFVVAVSANGSESPTERLEIRENGATTVTGSLTVSSTLTVTGKSYSVVRGSTVRGSTNTRIYRWTAQVDSSGSDVTYTDSAADGGYWTVATAGIYTVTASQEANTPTDIAIKAAAALSNTFDETSIKAVASTPGVGATTMHWTGPLAANDRIWISCAAETNPGGTSANYRTVTVTRIH